MRDDFDLAEDKTPLFRATTLVVIGAAFSIRIFAFSLIILFLVAHFVAFALE